MKEKEAVHLSWRTQKCYICNYFGGSRFWSRPILIYSAPCQNFNCLSNSLNNHFYLFFVYFHNQVSNEGNLLLSLYLFQLQEAHDLDLRKPDVHAEPEEAQIPLLSSKSNSPSASVSGKQKFTFPGRRLVASPFNSAPGIFFSPSINCSRSFVT